MNTTKACTVTELFNATDAWLAVGESMAPVGVKPALRKNHKEFLRCRAFAQAEYDARCEVTTSAQVAASAFVAEMNKTDHSGEITVAECTDMSDDVSVTLKRYQWEELVSALEKLAAVRNQKL